MTALTKSFGDHHVFANVSFDIRRHDRIAIVGPNGSGKTTLLNALAGTEPVDSGEVRWTKGTRQVSFNQLVADLDHDDTVSHAVNAMPGSLAFAATKK